MLPDAAAVDARDTGATRAGVYTGVWTAGETLGLALGPAVYAFGLALGQYHSHQSGAAHAVQPGSALNAIVIGFSAVPCVLVLGSLVFLARYRLDEAAVSDPDPHPGGLT
jgi:Na+/melibiose symporter-like transporter